MSDRLAYLLAAVAIMFTVFGSYRVMQFDQEKKKEIFIFQNVAFEQLLKSFHRN